MKSVTVLTRKEFMDDALENYKSLPLETNEWDKKYTLDRPLPEHYVAQENPRAESVARQISERTRINFDAVVSGSYAKSFDDSIRIVKAEDVSEAFLEGKLFKSRDDKLAAYSNAHSKYFIMIDSKGRKERSMNLLFLTTAPFRSR